MTDFEELARGAVEYAGTQGAEYSDARIQLSQSLTIQAENGRMRNVSHHFEKGLGIRVEHHGSTGFASTNLITKASIKHTVDLALKIADSLPNIQIEMSDAPVVRDVVKTRYKMHPRDISIQEKAQRIIELEKQMKALDHSILTITPTYAELYGKNVLATSEGTYIETYPMLVGINLMVTARERNLIKGIYDELSGVGGYELVNSWNLEEWGGKCVKRVKSLLLSSSPPSGRLTAVLDNTLAAVVMHETIGHMAEADFCISGSSELSKRVSHRIAREALTIVDEGTISGGYEVKYDDEGVPKKTTVIVRDGVLENLLHSRETAKAFSTISTGNARAQSYNHPPRVRQTNLSLHPGKCSVDELFEDLQFGIYVKGSRGGTAGLDGSFVFSGVEAYLVERGEITKPIGEVSLSGQVLEILDKIDAIANDYKCTTSIFGGCGKKGQLVYNGIGSPHVRVSEILVGGPT